MVARVNSCWCAYLLGVSFSTFAPKNLQARADAEAARDIEGDLLESMRTMGKAEQQVRQHITFPPTKIWHSTNFGRTAG